MPAACVHDDSERAFRPRLGHKLRKIFLEARALDRKAASLSPYFQPNCHSGTLSMLHKHCRLTSHLPRACGRYGAGACWPC